MLSIMDLFPWTILFVILQPMGTCDEQSCARPSLKNYYSQSLNTKCNMKSNKDASREERERLPPPIPPGHKEREEKEREKAMDAAEKKIYTRLPEPRKTHINEEHIVELTEGYYAKLRTLSVVPPIFEIDSFFDEEECDLLIAYAKHKGQKLAQEKEWTPFIHGKPDTVFQEWDYNEDGVVDIDEIALAPGKSDIMFTKEDADDMIFLLKMDKNGDGKITLEELKNTDLSEIKKYVDKMKENKELQRNGTTGTTWIWHDKDELLRFGDEFFYEYHKRIAKVTGLPEEIIMDSEAIQVQQFKEGNFQLCRHDSEYAIENVPCCLFGDRSNCRLCRYMSLVVFLNDVEEGGEMVFPLANTSYQDILDNPGEWRGYFTYAKTTGSKTHFTTDLIFSLSGVNRLVSGSGKDDVGSFKLINGIISGETVRLEKKYEESEQGETIKYAGKIIGGTQIYGKWWVPGQNRLQGEFHMWSRSYQIFSKNATDSCNIKSACKKSNVVIQPRKGKAILWYNHHKDDRTRMVGQLNKESMVGHCDVLKGDKWIANIWLNVVGDGVKELRAWRRGLNWMSNLRKYDQIMRIMGTENPPLPIYLYEEEYERDMLKGDQNFNRTVQDVESYRTAKAQIKNSHILNAVTSLLNVIDESGLKTIAGAVHGKLSLTCIPLVVEDDGRISIGEGRR